MLLNNKGCNTRRFLDRYTSQGGPLLTEQTITLAGAWAGGTEYGVNFVLLIKIVCLVLCVTSFLFVIFLVD